MNVLFNWSCHSLSQKLMSEKSCLSDTESETMDRLTTLMERFHLSVRVVPEAEANLIVVSGDDGRARTVVFRSHQIRHFPASGTVLLSARVEWAGTHNPLVASLPDRVCFDLSADPEARALVEVMQSEVANHRCGAQSVLNRLGDVLFVRLLRDQIERGASETGLLAGMADPRLSRAIVAMHDHPGRVWSNGDLAQEAGLSLSRFSELFAEQVGETPMGYLRRWRLILARQDIKKGDRVDAVARRYAYGSPEGFTRAFRRAYGVAPTSLRGA